VESTCAAIAALLAPHGEVVLHDLASDRILALWNPLSGRVVGDPSLLADLGDLAGAATSSASASSAPSASSASSAPTAPIGPIGPYAQTLPDGRRMAAVSAVVPDGDGVARGLVCVNVDRGPLDRLAAFAATWLAPRTEPPEPLFRHDWRERVGRRVGEFCAERGLVADRLDPAARRDLIAVLDAEGLFAVRRAADLVAGALGVSRATVYAQLKEIRL
jgi:predicted transcriptional regulator YheO